MSFSNQLKKDFSTITLALIPAAIVLNNVGRIIAPLAAFLLVIHGLFNPTGQTVLLAVGPLALKQEGLTFALLMTSRILCFLGATLLLVFTTPPAALMLALAQHGAAGGLRIPESGRAIVPADGVGRGRLWAGQSRLCDGAGGLAS